MSLDRRSALQAALRAWLESDEPARERRELLPFIAPGATFHSPHGAESVDLVEALKVSLVEEAEIAELIVGEACAIVSFSCAEPALSQRFCWAAALEDGSITALHEVPSRFDYEALRPAEPVESILAVEFGLHRLPPGSEERIAWLDERVIDYLRAEAESYGHTRDDRPLDYDREAILSNDDLYYVPACWIGCAGFVVEIDGRVQSIGGAPPRCSWPEATSAAPRWSSTGCAR